MTISTRLFGLIMTAALWSSVVSAQGLSATGTGEDLPPDLTLPSQGAENLPTPPAGQATGMQGGPSLDAMQPTDSGDGYLQGEGCDPYTPQIRSLWTELAPIESTGTWLRRGFWYAETDAVIYNRMWNRKDKRFAAEDINVIRGPSVDPNTGNGSSLGFN